MFARPVLSWKRLRDIGLKGRQIIRLPETPTCLGPLLVVVSCHSMSWKQCPVQWPAHLLLLRKVPWSWFRICNPLSQLRFFCTYCQFPHICAKTIRGTLILASTPSAFFSIPRAAQRIKYGRSAWDATVPALLVFYSIILYYIIFFIIYQSQ
jgi:hypothetical protein